MQTEALLDFLRGLVGGRPWRGKSPQEGDPRSATVPLELDLPPPQLLLRAFCVRREGLGELPDGRPVAVGFLSLVHIAPSPNNPA